MTIVLFMLSLIGAVGTALALAASAYMSGVYRGRLDYFDQIDRLREQLPPKETRSLAQFEVFVEVLETFNRMTEAVEKRKIEPLKEVFMNIWNPRRVRSGR